MKVVVDNKQVKSGVQNLQPCEKTSLPALLLGIHCFIMPSATCITHSHPITRLSPPGYRLKTSQGFPGTHVDGDTTLEDAVRLVRNHISLLLCARGTHGLVVNRRVEVLPLVAGR